MKDSEITEQRLQNQHLAAPDFQQPSDVVSWLGAVQAQDFAGAKWALGLRMPDAVEAGI